jgi:hypothetical protein
MIKGILPIDSKKSKGTHLAVAVQGINNKIMDNIKIRMFVPADCRNSWRETLAGKARSVGRVWIVDPGTKFRKFSQSTMGERVLGYCTSAARCSIAMCKFMYQSRQHGPSTDPESPGPDSALSGKSRLPRRDAEDDERGMKVDPDVTVRKQLSERSGTGGDASEVDIGRRFVLGDPNCASSRPPYRVATGVWQRDEPIMWAEVISDVDLDGHIPSVSG